MKTVFLTGLCGQSGSGKTSILEQLDGAVISDRNVHIAPNFIKQIVEESRSSFNILTPDMVLELSKSESDIQSIYKDYMSGQRYIQSRYIEKIDSKIYDLRFTEERSILISDRTMIDFYLYSKSALKYFEQEIGVAPNKDVLISLDMMKISTTNYMNVFYNLMISVPPHGGIINNECRGSRLTGTLPLFTGDNWYGSFDDIGFKKIKQLATTEIVERVNEVKTLIGGSI